MVRFTALKVDLVDMRPPAGLSGWGMFNTNSGYVIPHKYDASHSDSNR